MMLKKLTEALQMVEAGYDGYSMSNNARAAYDAGMMPLSKWTKSDILDGIREEYNIPEEVYAVIAKLPLGYLRDKFLETREWHHTSSMYNATDFYQIDSDFLDTDNTAEGMIDFLKQDYAEWKADYDKEKAKKKAVKDSKGDFCYFKYLVWGGSRAHPRAYEEESYGYVKGDWIYFADENGNLTGRKKGLYSNGTEVIKYLEPGEKMPVKEEPKKKEKVSKPSGSVKPRISVFDAGDSRGSERWYEFVTKNKGRFSDYDVIVELVDKGDFYVLDSKDHSPSYCVPIYGVWSKPIREVTCSAQVIPLRDDKAELSTCPERILGSLNINGFEGAELGLENVVVDMNVNLTYCKKLRTLKGLPQVKGEVRVLGCYALSPEAIKEAEDRGYTVIVKD